MENRYLVVYLNDNDSHFRLDGKGLKYLGLGLARSSFAHIGITPTTVQSASFGANAPFLIDILCLRPLLPSLSI